jgi:hypothetical protein
VVVSPAVEGVRQLMILVHLLLLVLERAVLVFIQVDQQVQLLQDQFRHQQVAVAVEFYPREQALQQGLVVVAVKVLEMAVKVVYYYFGKEKKCLIMQ